MRQRKPRDPDRFADRSLAARVLPVRKPAAVEDPMPEPLRSVSVAEAAKGLGCSKEWVQQLFGEGKLKGFRNGRIIRVFVASLVEYVEAGGHVAGGAA